MTQAHERTATLSDLIAEEIRALMARKRMSGRQLASQLKVSPSWISYRLSGKQPIDLNDLALIAKALDVGVHELLPSPEEAAKATLPCLSAPERTIEHAAALPSRPRDNRPSGHPGAGGARRTARLPRDRGPK